VTSLSKIKAYQDSRLKLVFFPFYWCAKLIKIMFKRQFIFSMKLWSYFKQEALLSPGFL